MNQKTAPRGIPTKDLIVVHYKLKDILMLRRSFAFVWLKEIAYLPMVLKTASKVLAAALRKCALSFEQAISIGLRSGL